MQLSTVRRAIASAVASGVTGKPLQCYGYMPHRPEVPAFCVAGITLDPHMTAKSRDDVEIVTYVFVSSVDDNEGQALLDEYLSRDGTNSIRLALLAASGKGSSTALSGAADAMTVRRIEGYRMYDIGDGALLFGAQIVLRVVGSA